MRTVCKNCGSTNLKGIFSGSFHDVLHCPSCGYDSIIPLESCCRSGLHVVTEHVDPNGRHSLFYQCINCGGAIDRQGTGSIGNLYSFISAKFDQESYQSWKKARAEEGLCLYKRYSS